MVSLIEHATDVRTPTATSWLIGGSMAVLCVSLAVIVALMPDRPGAAFVPYSLVGCGRCSRSSPRRSTRGRGCLRWSCCALLTLVWVEAFVRHARLGEPFVEDDALA